MNAPVGSSPQISRRTVLRAGALGVGAAALAGCNRGLGSSQASSDLQFMFWGEGNQNEKLLAAIDIFKQRNPKVKVNPQYSGFSGYYDKLATRVAGGNPPDIFQVHLPYLLEYVRRDAVHSLDAHADKLGLASIPKDIVTTCKLDGHYYFALLGAATQPAVVYDKTALEQLGLGGPDPGWNLDQYQAVMKEVYAASKQQLHGTADVGGSPVQLEPFLRGFGKQLFTDEGKLGFTKEEFGAWLQLWQAMRENGSAVPMDVTAGAQGFQNDPVVLRKAAYTGTATSRGLPSMKSLTKDELGIAPFPSSGRETRPGTNIIPAGWFAISKKSKNVDDAVALLSFLTGDPDAAKTMGMARGVPINPAMRDVIKPTLAGLDKVVFDNYVLIAAKDLAPLQAYPPGAGQLLQSSLATANQTVGFGKASVAQAAEQFFADAARVLK